MNEVPFVCMFRKLLSLLELQLVHGQLSLFLLKCVIGDQIDGYFELNAGDLSLNV